MTVASEKTDRCFDFELLISKSCDGECSPSEAKALGVHLAECGHCRHTLFEYRRVRDLMVARLVARSCPASPPVVGGKFRLSALKKAFSPRRAAGWAAIAAACIAFFFMGRQLGVTQSRRAMPEMIPSNVAATPSMWVESSPA